jgi:hypothetical protein
VVTVHQYRIECVALAKEPIDAVWQRISGTAQEILRRYAPHLSFHEPVDTWRASTDEWHHWRADFTAAEWVDRGTLLYAALVVLMLRMDADLMDFVATLYYRPDENGDWIECG